MKKFIIAIAIVAGAFYMYPDYFQSFLGLGKTKFGISKDDPLGKPDKIDQVLIAWGFSQLKSGTPGKPRVVEYSDNDKLYPDFKGIIKISVGEEEYIQNITAVFVGTQHGYSPARKTKGEIFAEEMWRACGGGSAKFAKISDGKIKYPYGITIPDSHMQADFAEGEVKGNWMYSDTTPMEIVILALK